MEGAHPIHRSIFGHWVWDDKPFAMGQAWVDLILLANHADSRAVIRGRVYEVKRGQVFRSKLVLGERWGWSRGKVDRFLVWLEKDQMILQETGQHAPLITLLNYDRLHHEAFKKRTTADTPSESPSEHQADQGWDIYNNGKNENNEKKLKKRSDQIFTEKEKAILQKEIAQSLNHGVDSEANNLQFQTLVEQVVKAKDVKDRFGYAIASARNLKNGFRG